VTVFQQPHYSESFVTSILLSIPEGAEGAANPCGPCEQNALTAIV